MTETDRALLVNELASGLAALENAVASLDRPQWNWRCTPEAWTILECVEHVAITERFLLDLISGHATAGDPVYRPNFEKGILRAGADRNRKFQAPEPVKPTGRYATISAALDDLRAARAGTLQWLDASTADLRASTVPHPVAGRVSTYECLLLLAIHPPRHAAHIHEIRSHADFPAAN